MYEVVAPGPAIGVSVFAFIKLLIGDHAKFGALVEAFNVVV
jgi:hypothetical protein